MDKGEIIEQGSHEDLLAQKGRYHTLWKEQLPSVEKHEEYDNTNEEIDTMKDGGEKL